MKSSDERKVANEVIFREHNVRVTTQLGSLLPRENILSFPIAFTCECSHADCREQINMTIEEYENAHKDRRQFIIIPGHTYPDIETVVDQFETYHVVRKNEPTSEVI
jgi:hypothetical protein